MEYRRRQRAAIPVWPNCAFSCAAQMASSVSFVTPTPGHGFFCALLPLYSVARQTGGPLCQSGSRTYVDGDDDKAIVLAAGGPPVQKRGPSFGLKWPRRLGSLRIEAERGRGMNERAWPPAPERCGSTEDRPI